MIFTGRFVGPEEALDIGTTSTPKQKSRAPLLCAHQNGIFVNVIRHWCKHKTMLCYVRLVQAFHVVKLCHCLQHVQQKERDAQGMGRQNFSLVKAYL